VVFNPGGTNERFARANFPDANQRLHPDNRTIFESPRSRRSAPGRRSAPPAACRQSSPGPRNPPPRPGPARRDGGTFKGADVTMAEDLAKALGVSLTIVPTTWNDRRERARGGRSGEGEKGEGGDGGVAHGV
jgi:ABC-type amino acid transport substrate-binding protein